MQEFEKEDLLDAKLRMRKFESPSAFFSQRIINIAAHTPRNTQASILAQLREVFADFILPKPAYAFAIILLLGFGIGLSVDDGISMQNENTLTLSSIFNDDGASL